MESLATRGRFAEGAAEAAAAAKSSSRRVGEDGLRPSAINFIIGDAAASSSGDEIKGLLSVTWEFRLLKVRPGGREGGPGG